MLVVLLINLAIAAGPPKTCNHKHTDSFIAWENCKDANCRAKYLIAPAYDADATNACEIISCDKIRKEWIAEGYELGDASLPNTEKYQCEHIIDQKNSIEPFKVKDIRANLIPALAIWNQQIGGRCWDVVVEEKTKMYGDAIFNHARQSIINCGKTVTPGGEECVPPHPPYLMYPCLPEFNIGFIITGSLFTISLIFNIALALCLCKKRSYAIQ